MNTLFLVATPIGNLEDITLRALRVLGEVGLIGAEDTRHTRKLLNHYQIYTPVVSYHEHNKDKRQQQMLDALMQGDVALVSDAGMPSLSDPGYELVQAALDAGYRVSAIPGASAPIAALVVSGLPTDAFLFLGYLPRRSTNRRKLLKGLEDEQRTLLFFEVPHRLCAALEDLGWAFGPTRPIAVCRELTKLHEEIYRGSIQSVREHFLAHAPRGEITLVVGGSIIKKRWKKAEVQKSLEKHIHTGMTRSQAAREVASLTGWSRKEVYQMSLEDE